LNKLRLHCNKIKTIGILGEVFAPDIDPECDPDCQDPTKCALDYTGTIMVPCHPGRWITPIVMTVYLLVANILLINLLIASFNTIYNRVNAMSVQLYNFQRFDVVMEYEERPILPVPFTVLSHIHLLCKCFWRSLQGRTTAFESGLKVVLNPFDMERLYDFEEEGVEALLRQVEENEKSNLQQRYSMF